MPSFHKIPANPIKSSIECLVNHHQIPGKSPFHGKKKPIGFEGTLCACRITRKGVMPIKSRRLGLAFQARCGMQKSVRIKSLYIIIICMYVYIYISSYINVYHHISSYIIHLHISSYIIHHHTSSYIIIYHHISSYIIIYHHILSYIIIYHHVSSPTIIYHQISSYIIIHHHTSYILHHTS